MSSTHRLRTLTRIAVLVTLPTMLVGQPAFAQTSAIEIENCGRTLSFDQAPQRVVSIGQGTHEILLSLGLADSIVGTGVWLAPLPEHLAEVGSALHRIDAIGHSPSFEAVLELEPDLVAVQWINDVGPDSGRIGTFDQFQDIGVPVYVSAADCAKSDFNARAGDGARQEPWSVELLEQEIRELASIFDVQDAGEVLIADNRTRIEDAAAAVAAIDAADISILYWFSSIQLAADPYVAGQLGASGWISRMLGITNVIDSNDEWPMVSWETIAERNPTVIVLGTMERRTQPGDDVAEKHRFLQTDPVASQMSAVVNGHLIELDAQSMNPTLRAVDGMVAIANGLRELGLIE